MDDLEWPDGTICFSAAFCIHGTYRYTKVVSLKALNEAFGKAFAGQHLDLSRRVVMIHGVSSASHLPASVAALGTIPADITLPIACGKIERAGR